jgi:hypothetical protein
MAESRLQVVFGTGQVGTALAAHHLHAISTADALAVHLPGLR